MSLSAPARYLSWYVSPCVLLLIASCGGSGPRPVDAREDGLTDAPGGDAEVGGPGSCLGMPGYTRPSLGAAVAANGARACNTMEDLDLLCGVDLGAQVQTQVGPTCVSLAGTHNLPALRECTETALISYHPTLTAACRGCYTEAFACTASRCLQVCLVNGLSAECQACQLQAGCLQAFYSCSGLPAPSGLDGGAPPEAGDASPDGPRDASDAVVDARPDLVDAGPDAPPDAASPDAALPDADEADATDDLAQAD